MDASSRVTSTAGAAGVPPSHRHIAAMVANTLQALNFDVRIWEDSRATGGATRFEIVVADADALRLFSTSDSRAHAASSRAASVDEGTTGGLPPGVLRRVLDHVERNLSGKVDLRDLAALSGLSEGHFARAFKQSMGEPPHRHVLTRRIAVASVLLASTQTPLTEIALAVGFSDHSHFSRMFARVTGEAPSNYRRRRQ
jgi:transcriptional regulator GlxA family with amidase domain